MTSPTAHSPARRCPGRCHRGCLARPAGRSASARSPRWRAHSGPGRSRQRRVPRDLSCGRLPRATARQPTTHPSFFCAATSAACRRSLKSHARSTPPINPPGRGRKINLTMRDAARILKQSVEVRLPYCLGSKANHGCGNTPRGLADNGKGECGPERSATRRRPLCGLAPRDAGEVVADR